MLDNEESRVILENISGAFRTEANTPLTSVLRKKNEEWNKKAFKVLNVLGHFGLLYIRFVMAALYRFFALYMVSDFRGVLQFVGFCTLLGFRLLTGLFLHFIGFSSLPGFYIS